MTRFKLVIEYDGGKFYGWQKQDDVPSIQGALERAATALDGQEVRVQGAGRTDAGVHALGQVAHLDLQKSLPADRVRDALNHHLRPDRIAVLAASEVDDEFHARFSARARHYLYRISARRAPLTLDAGQVWRVPRALDADRMQEAAQILLGQHDFSTFRDSYCQAKSPVKTLDRCDVNRFGDEIEIVCEARSFLHSQVRSMVGSLVETGYKKWSVQDFADAFFACDRSRCGPVAPPDGLYLTQVLY
ncbi:tRNA pseudouridine(38-40) synthase [hydrothermal vent metagenome]|uniref:tRNA pseudouridine(38-40) synthase n=1 Tax=hydrothermal vent metagenome TaxID=652676 RepID=A0A3B0RG12_9ZZZZ